MTPTQDAPERAVTTSVVLPAALLAAYQAIAQARGVSVSAVIRWACQAYLDVEAPK